MVFLVYLSQVIIRQHGDMNRRKFRSGYWTPVAAEWICTYFGTGDTNAAVFKLARMRETDPNNVGPVLCEMVAQAMAEAYSRAVDDAIEGK